MLLNRDSWNKDNYKEFIDYLFEIRDSKYKDFHSSLGVDNVIGIRIPVMRNIAKEIYKGNYKEFLSLVETNYYEEITIYGFIVGYIKELATSVYYLDKYKNMINNWASCDTFCASYKIVKKNKDYFFNYIKNNISSKNLWIRRLCFVLLLDYYVEEEYIDDIFILCDKYNTSDYYVQMAVAWLISVCYVKYKDKTINYIKNNRLDDFTHNKSIQKIKESLRISKEDKMLVDKLKRY